MGDRVMHTIHVNLVARMVAARAWSSRDVADQMPLVTQVAARIALPLGQVASAQKAGAPFSLRYWIAAKASTRTRKSGLANCGTGTVALSGEGGPK